MTIAILDGPPAPPSVGATIFHGVYAGPLPRHAKDSPFADWVHSGWRPQSVGHVAVVLRVGAPRINLGEIATGPIKAVIDGLWPLLGGSAGRGEDWRIWALRLERGAPEVPADGIAVTVGQYAG